MYELLRPLLRRAKMMTVARHHGSEFLPPHGELAAQVDEQIEALAHRSPPDEANHRRGL